MATRVSSDIADGQLALITGADCWISLHHTDPKLDGLNEIDGIDYARVEALSADWLPPADELDGNDEPTGRRFQTLDAIVDFGIAGSNWGEVKWFGIWTEPTGGTYLGAVSLTVPQTISEGNTVQFPAGAIRLFAGGV